MYSSFISCVIFSLSFLIPDVSCSGDQCRHLVFGADQALEGKRLINHVIRIHDIMMADFCDALCYMEHNCASYNLMRRSEAEGHKCELNNSTHEAHENDLEEDPNYVYRGTKSACVINPCENNSTCQTGFTDKGYRCLCTLGFQGHECQNDVDECASGAHECSANAECNNTKGSYSCSCKLGFSGGGRQCEDINECASGTHGCSGDAVCTNTEGSYICTCQPGYFGDGRLCEDIDECSTPAHDCNANAECNNTKGSYGCMCKPGFSGDGRECEDIDECALGTHDCSANAVCNNAIGSYVCTCIPGYFSDEMFCKSSPCKELFDKNLANGNKAYQLTLGSVTLPVYCHMTNDLGACGGGGWTLVMKMSGKQQNFRYDSNLWRNKETFYVAGGETGLDLQETKLPSYWSTPFSKICLGMKIGHQMNFVVINKQANSLYSLIADEQYRATSLGRNTWKTLIGSQASLQTNCNKEGFNAVCTGSSYSKARIGFIGNNENNCGNCDSRIGFGTEGYPNDDITCGNVARHEPDNGDTHIEAMGYIFVQ
ncbi:uncharacterized protein LOC144636308 [Oculina patagonica]